MENLYSPLELKFADNAPLGQFSGYASFFGNIDSHGDVVRKGAFDESLAEKKAEGRPVPMHLMHRAFGGDGLPVGVWTNIAEDDKGLKVDGKISGMNTDAGKLIFERVKDGALGGLSIGFKIRPDGAIIGKSKSDPKRTLINLDLKEISLVDSPSNAMTRVDAIKSAMLEEFKELMKHADVGKATAATVAAMMLHHSTMSRGDSPTTDERAQLHTHLQDIHEALTGQRMPPGMKSAPETIREFEALLRVGGYSNSQARSIAEGVFKTSRPRDEEVDTANDSVAFMKALLSD
jgi:HK97 family phage prohead protease